MSKKCPMCKESDIKPNLASEVHGTEYWCGTWIARNAGGTSYQGTECKLRCELAEARKLIADYCAAVALDPYAEPPMFCRAVRDAHNAMVEYYEQHKPKEGE